MPFWLFLEHGVLINSYCMNGHNWFITSQPHFHFLWDYELWWYPSFAISLPRLGHIQGKVSINGGYGNDILCFHDKACSTIVEWHRQMWETGRPSIFRKKRNWTPLIIQGSVLWLYQGGFNKQHTKHWFINMEWWYICWWVWLNMDKTEWWACCLHGLAL